MSRFGVQMSLVMPPPGPVELPSELSDLARAAGGAPDRLAMLAGGESLNAMVQQAIKAGSAGPDLQRRFEQTASAIVQTGAVGFGEMTALHISFTPDHPYEAAPPDHLLFLLLADIAARNNVPVDFHMDAVVQDMPTPIRFTRSSTQNPRTLAANVAAFERLLSHNRNARIVWAHVGWDNTGEMTVSLLRRLLAAHPNLYLQIKIDNPPTQFSQNRVLDQNGTLRSEWLDLMRAFPDRFVLGTDSFYTTTGVPSDAGLRQMQSLVQQLPADLARKVGFDNPIAVYRLQ